MGKVLPILLVSLAVLAAIAAAERHARQSDTIDPSKIEALLNNQAYVAAQRKCLLATDSDAATMCDKVGKRLRENLVPSIKKGDCVGCSTQDRTSLAMVIVTVQKKYPEIWKDVSDHYQITQKESDDAKSWANDVLAKKN